MTNLDIIARMAINGWSMIPAEPCQKQTYCKWGTVTPENYSFSDLFAGYPIDCNAAILCADTVAVIDFDAHGPEPNGLTAYRRIEAVAPQMFYGAIVERTQSNGIHAFFAGLPGTSTYTVNMKIDGKPVNVEVLTGRKLCYCSPSVTEKGEYRVISKNNFLNTRPRDLPKLPAIFHRPLAQKREWKVPEGPTLMNITPDELDFIIDHYKGRTYGHGNSNNDARVYARILMSFRLGQREAERHVKDYIIMHSKDHQLHDAKEPQRLVEYAIKKGAGDPAIPYNALIDYRKTQERRKINRLAGVSPCPAT